MNNAFAKLAWFLAFVTAWVSFIIYGHRWSDLVGEMWAMIFWMIVAVLLLLGQLAMMVWELKYEN